MFLLHNLAHFQVGLHTTVVQFHFLLEIRATLTVRRWTTVNLSHFLDCEPNSLKSNNQCLCPGPEVCLIPLTAGRALDEPLPAANIVGGQAGPTSSSVTPILIHPMRLFPCTLARSHGERDERRCPEVARCAMGNSANIPMTILEEGEALRMRN